MSSTGTLAIFKLDPRADAENPLQHLTTSRCDDLDEDVLFLQCNWHPSQSHLLGLTTSTGLVRLVQLDENWAIVGAQDVDIENSLEAWSIAFAPSVEAENSGSLTTIYSGGDDAMLRYKSYAPVSGKNSELLDDGQGFGPLSIRGQHDAGVTTILPLSIRESNGGRLVVTGSYDDHVRLFAIHDPAETYGMKRLQLLAEENLEGGVWRLDLIDIKTPATGIELRILASCMYAGARLIRISKKADNDQWSVDVLARFTEHKSMNYASAIVPGSEANESGKVECITTSFYDKLLCLWEYVPEPSQ